MLFTSGEKQRYQIANAVYDWFATQYDLQDVDVEVYHTDLTDDNVFGWCEQSDENEFMVTIHNELNLDYYVTTLLHELVHVTQTLRGLFDDDEREREAHELEMVLYNQFSQFCWNTILPQLK